MLSDNLCERKESFHVPHISTDCSKMASNLFDMKTGKIQQCFFLLPFSKETNIYSIYSKQGVFKYQISTSPNAVWGLQRENQSHSQNYV